ncbi:MAG: DUF2332 domain-containing protein [Gammaproteobacteria bacterium]
MPVAATDRHSVDAVIDGFRYQIESYKAHGSPLFATLLAAALEDPDLLDLASHASIGQPVGPMFMSVVHALVLRHPDAPLAGFFASVVAQPGPYAEAIPAFRAFCLRHAETIAALLAQRTLQQTAADRASYVALPLGLLAGECPEPLSFIELGCSAGLLLLFDRYHYDFGPAGQWGDPASRVRLRCELRGAVQPPLPAYPPRIARRVGVDLKTCDPGDRTQRDWICAALYPEWVEERARLTAALDLVAQARPRVVESDAAQVLPELMANMPGPVCVLSSQCLYQWPKDALDGLQAMLAQCSRERPVYRISIELPGVIKGTFREDYRAGRIRRVGGSVVCEITRQDYCRGIAMPQRLLGTAEGYGRWIEWLG